jgi:hypothetical protein
MKKQFTGGQASFCLPTPFRMSRGTQPSSWKGSDRWVRMIFKVMHIRGAVPVLASTIHSIILARYILRLEIRMGSQRLDKIDTIIFVCNKMQRFFDFPLRDFASFEMLNGFPEYLWVVPRKAKHAVAMTKNQASNLSSLVVMVYN